MFILTDHAGQEANEALLQENKRLRVQIDDFKVSILSTKWKCVNRTQMPPLSAKENRGIAAKCNKWWTCSSFMVFDLI